MKSPKKAQVPGAAHNGKKIATNNVKSSGYGQIATGRQSKNGQMGDSQREHVKDANTVAKKN
jgi:hypothetical protein